MSESTIREYPDNFTRQDAHEALHARQNLSREAFGSVGLRPDSTTAFEGPFRMLDANQYSIRLEGANQLIRAGLASLPSIVERQKGDQSLHLRAELRRCGEEIISKEFQELAQIAQFKNLHCSSERITEWQTKLATLAAALNDLTDTGVLSDEEHPLAGSTNRLRKAYAISCFSLAGELLASQRPDEARAAIAEAIRYGIAIAGEDILQCKPAPLRQVVHLLSSDDPSFADAALRALEPVGSNYVSEAAEKSDGKADSLTDWMDEVQELSGLRPRRSEPAYDNDSPGTEEFVLDPRGKQGLDSVLSELRHLREIGRAHV